MHPALTVVAVALYLGGAVVAYRRFKSGRSSTHISAAILALTIGALASHAANLLPALTHDGGLDLGFSNAVSLVAWVVIGLFVLAALVQPIESLALILLPVGATATALQGLWPHQHAPITVQSPLYAAHIVISLLAYGLLSVAVAQSLMHAVQEHALRRHSQNIWMRALPPLESSERLMFGMIWAGFALLTVSLASGLIFSDEIFGGPLRFTHHTVLSVIAWTVFAVLLGGRLFLGWRGRVAMRLALGGFTALALAYFGVKIVLELVLGR